MLLYPIKKGDGTTRAKQLQDRCRALLRGEFAMLWDAYDWSRQSTRRTQPLSDAAQLEHLKTKLKTAVLDNEPGKAARLVFATGVARGTDANGRSVTDLLRDKCPQKVDSDFTAEAAQLFPPASLKGPCKTEDPQQQESIVKRWRKEVHSGRKRVAPNGDGFRLEHLQLAMASMPQATSNLLEVMSCHLIPREVCEYLSTTAIMALLKRDLRHMERDPHINNGVRPIGKPHALQKVVSKPLARDASRVPDRGQWHAREARSEDRPRLCAEEGVLDSASQQHGARGE